MLGVSDAALQEELGLSIQTGGVVLEILRGVRLHFHSLVKGLTGEAASKAQLGLGHSYSRAKFNVNRADNMIIQSIALLDQLDKDINTFAMRVRGKKPHPICIVHLKPTCKVLDNKATRW